MPARHGLHTHIPISPPWLLSWNSTTPVYVRTRSLRGQQSSPTMPPAAPPSSATPLPPSHVCDNHLYRSLICFPPQFEPRRHRLSVNPSPIVGRCFLSRVRAACLERGLHAGREARMHIAARGRTAQPTMKDTISKSTFWACASCAANEMSWKLLMRSKETGIGRSL